MLSINDDNFVQDFQLKDAVVGQIGYGFIGKAVEALFIDKAKKVLVYDKFVPGTSTLQEVLAEAQVVFVAVPTPMDAKTGECHTKILESVLQDIQRVALEIERDLSEFIVVTKCTVPPGFTRRMQTRHALRIVFSPEFLTEANAVNDFKTAKRVLLGGDLEDARVVYKFFAGVWPDRLPDNYDGHPHGPVVIAQCDPEVAEMVKLTTNAYLATKVILMNEIYQICQKIGIKYDEVALLTCLDPRISQSHMKVPCNGELGFSGSCFPKDINNLRYICSSSGLNTGERLFTAVIERNKEVRGNHDWLQMEGRAVINSEEDK